MSLIINLFSGPCGGKSTTASGLFTEMKKSHFNVELTFEYPKQIAWEGNQSAMKDQFYITANQHRNISRLYGKVDYIIVDSPIILGSIYKDRYGDKNEYPSSFYDEGFDLFILNLFKKYNSLNILLKRDDSTYSEIGRFQTLEESKLIDNEIKELLDKNEIKYVEFEVNNKTSQEIFKYILDFKSISMVY